MGNTNALHCSILGVQIHSTAAISQKLCGKKFAKKKLI